MIGTNGADWRTAHQGCALQTLDSEGARQGKLDLTWLQNHLLTLTSDSNVEDKALVVHTDLHKDYSSVIKGLRRKRTILCQ
ncbi:hypothetical protein PoB_006385400 [Plakobranchus ocellatus]|uniref:Uncharacterized protein n=1 Tax=Plakobranchus ocellatus TaxID=259542 RepID=A0AAV4CZM0_9GAST|nr:hypothetical protein PoB_006385400 [Plakobranchus ocellatus]